jgi:hypothetical protein
LVTQEILVLFKTLAGTNGASYEGIGVNNANKGGSAATCLY